MDPAAGLQLRNASWRLCAGRALLLAIALAVAGCGPPSIDSPDPKERLKAVALIKGDDELIRIGRRERDPAVRDAAFARVTDRALLAAIVREETNPEVREAALGRMAFNTKLVDLAIERGLPPLRDGLPVGLRALGGIQYDSELARVAIGTHEQPVAQAAAQRIKNIESLVQVASECAFADVAVATLDRITDETSIASVARETRSPEVRLAIARRYEAAVRASKDDETVWRALSRIRDESILRQLESDGPTAFVRTGAQVERAGLGIPPADRDRARIEAMSLAAVAAVSAPRELVAIAMVHADEAVVFAAIDRLTDDALLAGLAIGSGKVETFKARAAARVMGGPFLDFLINVPNSGFRQQHVRPVAQAKLALREPRIAARHPGAKLTVELGKLDAPYTIYTQALGPSGLSMGAPTAKAGPPHQIEGETVSITIRSASGQVLAQGGWQTEFPERIQNQLIARFLPASVNLVPLFVDLLKRPEFTAEDRAELSKTDRHPELRRAAQLIMDPSLAER